MENFDDLFEENCFLPCIGEAEPKKQEVYIRQHKSLDTLLAELEVIKNNREELTAKEWHLAKLMQFHKQGIAPGYRT